MALSREVCYDLPTLNETFWIISELAQELRSCRNALAFHFHDFIPYWIPDGWDGTIGIVFWRLDSTQQPNFSCTTYRYRPKFPSLEVLEVGMTRSTT